MYFLLGMGIFQPAMLVYQRVRKLFHRIPTGRLPKPSLSAFCWREKLRWDHGSRVHFLWGKSGCAHTHPKTHIGLENRQKKHPTKKVVSQPPFSRDPGSPKLRMVSWNLNTLAFWKRLDTPTGHVWAILAGPNAACISLSSFHTEKKHTHTHTPFRVQSSNVFLQTKHT